MGRHLRVGIVVVCVMFSAPLIPSGAAQAQQSPTITVTPSTPLANGQTVTVTGSGFSPDVTTFGLAQCDAPDFPNTCVGQQVVFGSGGSFTATFRVVQVVRGVDCAAAPGRCFLGGANLNGVDAFSEVATVPLSFDHPVACVVTAVRSGPPAQQDVTVTDPDGIASITAVRVSNGTVSVPSFTPGTNGPIVLTATKTDQTKRTFWEFDVTDSTGVTTNCV